LRWRPPAGAFQIEVGLTIRHEPINHALVRPAFTELGPKALSHLLSGVGSCVVVFEPAHYDASSVPDSKSMFSAAR
jgi:hypothetical protein